MVERSSDLGAGVASQQLRQAGSAWKRALPSLWVTVKLTQPSPEEGVSVDRLPKSDWSVGQS